MSLGRPELMEPKEIPKSFLLKVSDDWSRVFILRTHYKSITGVSSRKWEEIDARDWKITV